VALYITEQGLKIRREGQRLQLFREKKLVRELRFEDLDEIYIFGRTHFTAQAIQALLKNKIYVHFLTSSGKYLGRLAPPKGKNIELRLSQFRAFEDEKRRLSLAKSFILAKVKNQRTFLRRHNRKLKQNRIAQAILQLKKQIIQVERSHNLENLRGAEGIAANIYFEVFGRLIQVKGLKFPGRIRRPPPDPINALLSLGYTLLCTQIWSMVEASSLDAYLGFLHVPEYGRPSLVLDLMEEWRPIIVDPLVVRVLNWGTIKAEDFIEEPWEEDEDFSSIHLSPQGLRKFLAQFHRRMEEEATYTPLNKRFRYKDIMQQQIWHLNRVLLGKEKNYNGFIFEH